MISPRHAETPVSLGHRGKQTQPLALGHTEPTGRLAVFWFCLEALEGGSVGGIEVGAEEQVGVL